MNSRIHILFVLLIALWGTVGIALATGQPPRTQAVPHPQFAAMLRGGDTPLPSRDVFLGWMFGMLQIALFVTCMSLGISRPSVRGGDRASSARRLGPGAFLVIGTLLYWGVFTQMVRADRAAALSGETPFLGPFPAGTTWMLLGLWVAPLVFVAAYLYGFSRWIIADADLNRFDELVASRLPGSENPS